MVLQAERGAQGFLFLRLGGLQSRRASVDDLLRLKLFFFFFSSLAGFTDVVVTGPAEDQLINLLDQTQTCDYF